MMVNTRQLEYSSYGSPAFILYACMCCTLIHCWVGTINRSSAANSIDVRRLRMSVCKCTTWKGEAFLQANWGSQRRSVRLKALEVKLLAYN